MPNKQNNVGDMLARIDERTASIQKTVEKQTIVMDGVVQKVTEYNFELYGNSGREGLVQKVERHDKAFWKACGIGALLLFVVEFIKGWLLK